jgi:ATP-dependent RNA helicase DDX5/DBP2
MKAHFASFPKTIVFRSKKTDCDELGYQLRQAGFRADVLHGDKSQDRRDATMDKFRRGVTRMIVATDVAARGIDIKDIECVVNYDFPASGIEDYVHRIGRTGRGSASGTAHSFITPEEGKKEAKDLIDILRRSEQEVPSQLEE